MDQLMNFAWKFMLPMTLIVIVSAAMWRFVTPAMVGPKPLGGVIRWLVCALVILAPYILLARTLGRGHRIAKRTYRFAE
jgi:NADH-quinone oxidoreductase subunit H